MMMGWSKSPTKDLFIYSTQATVDKKYMIVPLAQTTEILYIKYIFNTLSIPRCSQTIAMLKANMKCKLQLVINLYQVQFQAQQSYIFPFPICFTFGYVNI